jgi:hypothetical protein
MRKLLERLREKICKERGHNFSEREIKDREGMIVAEYRCLRCGQHYQKTPTTLEMEKFYYQTRGLFS